MPHLLDQKHIVHGVIFGALPEQLLVYQRRWQVLLAI